ncbi:MAG: hypothetical protein HGA19_23665 [Oscillochloris sp.]|nr:hypothetical protein [Oscillochloris sp.]
MRNALRRTWSRERAILGLGALWLLCWLALFHLYPLAQCYMTPGLALDNADQHLGPSTLALTGLLFTLLCALYLWLAWLLTRAPVPIRLWLTLAGLVVVAGVLNVLTHPIAAIDLFYYLSQIKLVYSYGANPYVTTFLPTFAHDPLVKVGAFLNWRLVYGPAWLTLAWPATLAGFGLLPALLAYKAWSLAFLLLCGILIAYGARDPERGRRAAFLLVANPLVLFEAVTNAHNDIMVATLLVAAIVTARRRPWLAPPLAIAAVAVKALALPLLPALALALSRRPWQRSELLRSALLTLVILTATIAPFWANGAMISGMLAAMKTQQTIHTSSVVSLLREYLALHQAPEATLVMARLACAGGFVLAWLAVTLGVRDLPLAFAAQLLLLYTLVSSFFPWYLLPVLALLALSESRAGHAYLLVASALALLSYPAGIWMRFHGGLSLFEMRLLLALPQLVPAAALLLAQVASPRPSQHDGRVPT